jgi:hypothetical protein
MPQANHYDEQAIRDRAYFIWEQEGRPEGRAGEHWKRAARETRRFTSELQQDHTPDEEKILDGRIDVNLPALLTKDVHGG